MLRPAEIETVVRRIVDRVQPRTVIVFGSYAKGTATIRSDLDILVIMETEMPIESRADILKPMFAHLLVPVDVHVHTPEEVDEGLQEPTSFIATVIATGRLAYKDR